MQKSYKVVTDGAQNEVWAIGFFSKEKAQAKIDAGYFHKFMYESDKSKKLIVIEE